MNKDNAKRIPKKFHKNILNKAKDLESDYLTCAMFSLLKYIDRECRVGFLLEMLEEESNTKRMFALGFALGLDVEGELTEVKINPTDISTIDFLSYTKKTKNLLSMGLTSVNEKILELVAEKGSQGNWNKPDCTALIDGFMFYGYMKEKVKDTKDVDSFIGSL